MKLLLSIKPKYVEKIFSGKKRFEYRKIIFKRRDLEAIVIYATKPIGKIVGEMRIRKIHQDTPENIWNKTKNFSGIEKDDFFKYFRDKNIAYAIEFENVIKYNNPISITYAPPQSYKYI